MLMPGKLLIDRNRLLAAALLLPSLIITAAWIGSAFAPRNRFFTLPVPPGATWRIATNYVVIQRVTPAAPIASLPAISGQYADAPAYGSHFSNAFGGKQYFFGWFIDSRGYYLNGTTASPVQIISISFIIPLLLTLPMAIASKRVWRRPTLIAARRAQGLCTSCGYDVRATPDCCPECGQPLGTASP
jgi:hypothetical protein